MSDELVIAGEVLTYSVRPGDVIVFRVDSDHLHAEHADHIRKHLAKVFPGHESIILARGASLSVVRPEDVE